jgi:hypothetical protein
MFDPNRDWSIARQLECETAGQWYELMRGKVPIQAIQAMSREQLASGRGFRDVLLDNIERGALIFVEERIGPQLVQRWLSPAAPSQTSWPSPASELTSRISR